MTCPHCGQPDVMPWRLWWLLPEIDVCPTCWCHAYEAHTKPAIVSAAPRQRRCGQCGQPMIEDATRPRHASCAACRAKALTQYHTRRRRLRVLKAG